MAEMIGKVSLQEKIAELESRIAALEARRIVSTVTTTRVNTTIENSKFFGEHWDKMWDEFNEVMKSAFKQG